MKLAVGISMLVLTSLLPACSDSTSADRPRVVASFYPLAFVAEQVGRSHVDVDNLTSPGVEPHDLELTAKRVGAVQQADLVVHQRGFQPAVDDAVEQADRPKGADVDVTALVRLHRDDPHTWLDPRTMIAVARAVAGRLADIDPDHRASYAANADRLERQLADVDDALSAGLKACRTRTIVTSHAAFSYLVRRYDLVQVPIAGLDPTNEPSPSQLADISSLVRREGITTIFTEELVSPVVAETVAREAGARTAILDPIEGLSDDTEDETYLTLMRRNLAALRTANGCR